MTPHVILLLVGMALGGCTSMLIDCQKGQVSCVDCSAEEAEKTAALLKHCPPPVAKP